MSKAVRVAELFGPTLQGEGPEIGREVYFLRLGGCDFRCNWCDSMHSVDPEKVARLPVMEQEQLAMHIMNTVPKRSTLVITGGNPCIHDLYVLVKALEGWCRITVETQGTIFQEWLGLVDRVVVSPKPPSAQVDYRFSLVKKFLWDLRPLDNGPLIDMKVVVFNSGDIEWALWASDTLWFDHVYLSVGTCPDDTNEALLTRYAHLQPLCSKIFASDRDVSWSLLPQMHVLLWGHKLGV